MLTWNARGNIILDKVVMRVETPWNRHFNTYKLPILTKTAKFAISNYFM